jgi:hypothetical protein
MTILAASGTGGGSRHWWFHELQCFDAFYRCACPCALRKLSCLQVHDQTSASNMPRQVLWQLWRTRAALLLVAAAPCSQCGRMAAAAAHIHAADRYRPAHAARHDAVGRWRVRGRFHGHLRGGHAMQEVTASNELVQHCAAASSVRCRITRRSDQAGSVTTLTDGRMEARARLPNQFIAGSTPRSASLSSSPLLSLVASQRLFLHRPHSKNSRQHLKPAAPQKANPV